MKLFPLKLVVIAALAIALFAGPSQAEMILYENNAFGQAPPPTGILKDTTPSITIDDNTWIATDWGAGGWQADGSIPPGTATHGAFLPFVPEAGLIYTLSATLGQPTDGVSGQWAAIGFTASDTTSTFWGTPNNASPWMLYRPADALSGGTSISSFTGPGINGSATHGNPSGEQTLKIVLDTTGTAWTAEWFVSGAGVDPVRTHTFTTNPTITHVALGRSGGAASNFSSFTLTVVPEPGSALVALVAVAGLLLVRRRR